MSFVDALQCGNYTRDDILFCQRSGVEVLTVTTSFWEDASETMDRIGKWNRFERENSDILRIVRNVSDFSLAKERGQVCVILGAQNSSPYLDRIDFVELFAQMGLLVVQVTYNNQNALGGSCYEPNDSGLSRFGREVIEEMSRCGVVADLSHVGDRTSQDVIDCSPGPVAITHSNPYSVFAHPRNKPDSVLKSLAERDGVLGLAAYNNISGPYCSDVERWCEMVCRAVDLMGVEHVGIGTDLSPNRSPDAREWMRKGRWTRGSHPGATLPDAPKPPESWFTDVSSFRDVEAELKRIGRFSEDEIANILGNNWLRLYNAVLS